ncbi:ATPase [Aureococcus anophagefferens]|nr:ATPase [Aureococcus anophagefferens]
MQPRVVLGALGHGWLFLGLMFLDPIILRRLLDGAGADSAAAARRNLGYAAALSASMFVRVACMEVCFFGSVRAMNNCRTAIVPLVFRAAVGSRTDEDSGKLTNLMATDADKLGRWSWTLFFAAQWSFAVVSLPAVAYCMYDLLGAGQDKRAKFPTSKAPFSAVFHSFRLIFGRAIISRNGLEALGAAALVGAATVVAANQAALEIGKRTKPAVLRLQEARDARAKLTTEMLAGVRLAKLRGWTASVKARVAAAREAEMAALKTTRYLDALNVFVGCVAALAVPVAIFSWYALMEWSINTLPDIYNLWSSLSPSVERLAEFLLRAPKEPAAPPPFPSDAAAAVDGAVGYGARAVATAKFECRRGEVVAVVGPVGSGKSTLLRSLCGAGAAVDGWAGTAPGLARAYVGQDPFLLTGTVVDNVAFGLPVDDARVDAAVDAHTGAALWERAIAPLAGRCAVVLATHQLAYAARPEVSRVVDLGPRRAGPLDRGRQEAPAVEEAPVAEPSVETHAPARREPVALEEVAAELRRLLAARGERSTALATRLERSLLGLDGDEPERRRGGFIAYRDFLLYLDAFGSRATSAGLAAVAVAACGCAVASNVWLSVWADDGAEGAAQTRFLVVYAAIGVLQAGLLALQTILLTLCALDASKTLHEKMLDGVLGAPLRFFDETPQGNALNRFLQDLANVDVDVPTVFLDQLTRTLTVASQLGLVLYFAPWVALMLPLALVPYGFIFSTRAGMDYMCGLATLEAQFVSVERVAEYCRLVPERDDGRGRAPAAPGSAAALVATDVALRARLARETVRANLLGPSATCGDETVWAALDRVGVAAAVRRLPGGLDHVCAERGDDFSAGERQLLALARALLPFPPPLLLCDEATANVDEATDAKVHDVLLRGLDATVLVVCHRLAHVAAFDLAVVLDDGRVVEEGRPADLLRDLASRLAGLVAAGKKGG